MAAERIDPDLEEQYEEAVRELLERWPETKMDPTLDRVRALTDLLGDPHRAYPVIQLTGTNGKTSTARMVETLLRELNLRTGRFTSPHLESVNERISLDAAPISVAKFVEVYEDVRPYVDIVDASQEFPMSFFEVLTGMAFAAFADAPVDVAVLEVGLGGTWDCTNVADAAVAVITPIDVDHSHILGDTPAAIAVEKAGIIKEGSFVVIGQQPVEAAEVLLRRASAVGATVAREGIEFGVMERQLAVGGQVVTLRGLAGEYEGIHLPLHGAYQAHNAACALVAVEAFLGVGTGGGTLDKDVVREAFAKVTTPGRLEVVRRGPTVLVDASHNPAGARVTASTLGEEFTFDHLVGVIAAMRDKDVQSMLEIFEPVLAELVVTRNASDRSLPVAELAEMAREVFGEERVHEANSLDDAIDQAIGLVEEAVPAGTSGAAGVIVTGSVVTAGEARTLLVPANSRLRAAEVASYEVVDSGVVLGRDSDSDSDSDSDWDSDDDSRSDGAGRREHAEREPDEFDQADVSIDSEGFVEFGDDQS
jgi:dihydrofolate synthase / folylpolyglutamate synthase